MGTSMHINRVENSTGANGGSSLTFKELTKTITIPGQSTLYTFLDAGSHRYELKTVSVKPLTNSKVSIRIDDNLTGGENCYESLIQDYVYDIANVPIIDKSGDKKVHAFVSNAGPGSVQVKVILKIVPYEGGNT